MAPSTYATQETDMLHYIEWLGAIGGTAWTVVLIRSVFKDW
jgi:hypothetical protein